METPASSIKLSELAQLIQDSIRDSFGGNYYWVVSEISNFTPRRGNQYFHLIEKDEVSGNVLAELSALSFQDGVAQIEHFEEITGQKFSNGIKVLAKLSVSFHPVYGLKIQLHQLDPSFTIGELRKQREATLKKLVDENPEAIKLIDGRYYSRNQSLKLPLVISKIAVISSTSSAGLEDFQHTLLSNSFGYKFSVDVYNTQVQGDDKGLKTVQKFIEIFNNKENYDIVVLVRGGGSQTDFLMYDAYRLCKAVARFPLPVFAGLGHLKDISICDMMAHTSEKTPTKVAEKILAHNRRFEESVINIQRMLVIRSQQLLNVKKEGLNRSKNEIGNVVSELFQSHKNQLNMLNNILSNRSLKRIVNYDRLIGELVRMISTRTQIQLANNKQIVNQVSLNIEASSLRLLRGKREFLEHYKSVFKILSPERTLARGFALIKKNGKIVADFSKITENEKLDIVLQKHLIQTTVNKNNKRDGEEYNL